MVNLTPSAINSLTTATISGLESSSSQLTKISNDINQNFINQQQDIEITPKEPTNLVFNLSAIDKPNQRTIEQSLVDTVLTKTQIQALLKMLEVENQLFDQSLGKIFDQKV